MERDYRKELELINSRSIEFTIDYDNEKKNFIVFCSHKSCSGTSYWMKGEGKSSRVAKNEAMKNCVEAYRKDYGVLSIKTCYKPKDISYSKILAECFDNIRYEYESIDSLIRVKLYIDGIMMASMKELFWNEVDANEGISEFLFNHDKDISEAYFLMKAQKQD